MRALFPLSLAALLMLNPALAGGVPIRTLLSGSGGQLNAGSNSFVVVKRTSDLKRFELAVIAANSTGGRMQDLILAVKKLKLSPSELDLFRGNATYAATRCFGLEPGQLPALSTWISAQNAAGTGRAQQTFGKVTAIYVHQNKPGAPYSTLELYRDEGQPGVAPWINYCTL